MASSVLDMPVLRYLWTSKQEYQVASWRAEMKIWGWVGCAVGKKKLFSSLRWEMFKHVSLWRRKSEEGKMVKTEAENDG